MLSWNKKVGAVNLGEEEGMLPKTRIVLQGMPDVRAAILFKLTDTAEKALWGRHENESGTFWNMD